MVQSKFCGMRLLLDWGEGWLKGACSLMVLIKIKEVGEEAKGSVPSTKKKKGFSATWKPNKWAGSSAWM